MRTAARRLGLPSLVSSLLFSTRFVTIWVATGVLVVVCKIIAPETLSQGSFSAMLPLAAIAASQRSGRCSS